MSDTDNGTTMMRTQVTINEVATGVLIAHNTKAGATGITHGAEVSNERIAQLGRYGTRVRQVLTGSNVSIPIVMKTKQLMLMTKRVVAGIKGAADTFYDINITHDFPDGDVISFTYRNMKLAGPSFQGSDSSEITTTLEFMGGDAPIIL